MSLGPELSRHEQQQPRQQGGGGVGYAFAAGAVVGWVLAPQMGMENERQTVAAVVGLAFETIARFWEGLFGAASSLLARARMTRRLMRWEAIITRAGADSHAKLKSLKNERELELLTLEQYYEGVQRLARQQLSREKVTNATLQ